MARPQEEELVEIASSERSMDDEVEDFDGWAEPLTPHPHQLTPEDQRRMDALQNTPFHMATPVAAPAPRARVNIAVLEAESDADADQRTCQSHCRHRPNFYLSQQFPYC